MKNRLITNRSQVTRRGQGPDYNQLWLDCAQRGLNTKPLIRSALQQLSINPADIECVGIILDGIRAFDTQEILDPDRFRLTNPTHAGKVDGPIRLGSVRHSRVPWGIHSEALTEHISVVGRTGGGKSVLIKTILSQLLEERAGRIIVFDRKQDFYDLASAHGLLYFLLQDFMDNWCAPPDGVAPMIWFNILAEILAAAFELRMASQGMLLDMLCDPSIIKDNNVCDYPTLRDIARRLYVVSSEGRASVRETSLRLGQRIGSLLSITGDTATSQQRPDWKALNSVDWALSLAGLATSVQSLCITIYFAKVLLYRVCNNLRSDKLETLIVLDEASVIFPRTATKRTSILLDYFQQARAFGIGVIFASQSMNLSDEIFANTAIKVAVGGFGHGRDFEAFGSAVGLTRPQRDFMRTISKPGSAVVKDIRYPQPFTVQIDKPEPSKNVTIDEIREISRQSRFTLYGHVSQAEAANEPEIATGSAPIAAVLDQPDQDRNTSIARSGSDQKYMQPSKISKPYQNAVRMIRTQVNHVMPFLFRQEASYLGKIRGGSTLIEAEKEALRCNLIIKHTLARAKTNICLWEVTGVGYELLKTQPPKWKSKGKYVHKFSVYRIKETFEKRGYRAKIEHRRSNGKPVDLVLSKDQEVIYVEVCASWPVVPKELSNIVKDLEGDPLPDEIILAITDRKMRQPLEKMISDLNLQAPLSRPVKVVLAGDLIEFLEITR